MKRAELLRSTGFNVCAVQETLRTKYTGYIHTELKRILGSVEDEVVDAVLSNVQNRLYELPVESDLSDLVFDCIRKEVLEAQRNNRLSKAVGEIPLLQNAAWNASPEKPDDMRLDVLLLHLSEKQRKYFLDRYYFFRQNTKVNSRYERKITRLINGKGIATFRFKHLGIPRRRIQPNQYVDYLDRIENYYIGRSIKRSAVWESPRISCGLAVRLMERDYRIASKSIPISCLAIVVLVLFTILIQLLNTV